MTQCLSPEQIALVRVQLTEARAAYHRLMTGLSVRVFIDQNGEQVQYTTLSKQDLYNYILGLQSKLPCGDTDGLDLRQFRPMQPYF